MIDQINKYKDFEEEHKIQYVGKLLPYLTARQRLILKMLNGWGYDKRSSEELADELKIKIESIKTFECKAIKQLKSMYAVFENIEKERNK